MDRYDFRVDIDFIEWKLNSQKIFSALLRRPSNVSSSIPRLKDFWFLTKLQGFCLKNNFHFTKKIFALNHYLASIYLQLQPVHEKYFKQGNFMPGHAHPNNWWVGWISAKFGTSTVYREKMWRHPLSCVIFQHNTYKAKVNVLRKDLIHIIDREIIWLIGNLAGHSNQFHHILKER